MDRIKPRIFFAAALVAVLASACAIKVPKGRPVALDNRGAEPERVAKYEHAGWTIARATLHNHTVYSDGCRTPEDLLELARIQGIAVLAYNDHREGTMCIKPLLCADAGGVESAGYDKYFDHLRDIQELAREQDMIALKGVEVSSPYFYNNGKFPHIVIRGQFQHFTVYGIEDPEILDNMPVSHDMTLSPQPFPGDTPYQEFVDYIHDNGGIVHAVHPESVQDDWLGTVHVLTPAPVWNLHLKNLAGFSILPEGFGERTGAPGGLWDTALAEYLAGMRERPLWASADSDYHGPRGSLVTATTLFYMREFTEAEIYRCMREGRMVALQGEAFQDVYVAEWWVSGGGPPKNPVMLGEEAKVGGTPKVRFALNRDVPGCRTRLVRNGVVIYEADGSELSFADSEQGSKRAPAYYRIEVAGPEGSGEIDYDSDLAPASKLFTNPIFVRF